MTNNSVIKPKGLYTNPNPFSVSPEGALLRADNLVIDEDGTVRSRRGQELLSSTNALDDQLSASTNWRPEKIWWFNNRVWAHFKRSTADVDSLKNRIVYWDFTINKWVNKWFTQGDLVADDTGKIKIRQTEANRRMLFTTKYGVQRIASGVSLLTTELTDAGVCKGIDLRNTALTAVGVDDQMPTLSTCAYKVVWKSMDENKIVTVGSPSGKITVRNTTAGSRTPTLRIGIPSGLGSAETCQVFRTQFFSALPNGQYPDPGDEMYLCSEITPTATDLANFYISFSDICPDALLGEPCYTNATQDGPLQERGVPPCSKDVAYFNDTGFYLNTVSKQRMILSILAVNPTLIAANRGITVGDVIQIGDLAMLAVDNGTTGFPTAAESIGGPTYWAFGVDRTTGAGSEVTRVIKTTESFVYKYNLWSNVSGGRYYAYNITSADDIVGRILFEEREVNGTVKAYFGTTRLDNPVQYIPTPVADTAATVGLSKQITNVNNNGTSVTITTAAAHGYSTGDNVFFSWFGTYTALTNSKVPPNVYNITVITGTTYRFTTPSGSAIGVDAAATIGYSHEIINTAQSDNDTRNNRIFYSVLQEPESVPLLNYFDVGRNDADGLAMRGLGQSLFIFKEDGLFRLTGYAGAFQVDEFDPSVRLLAPESIAVVNNCIYCLTDQGVVRITESGAQVISREIENEIFAAIAINTSVARTESFGVGYEDDRKYILWMPSGASDTKPQQAFVYNMFTKAWTKRTDANNYGIVARRNDVLTDVQHLYTVKDRESWLTVERKTNSVKDYADESFSMLTYFISFLPSAIKMNPAMPNYSYFMEANSLIVGDTDTNRAIVLSAVSSDITVETNVNNTAEGIAATNPNGWTGPATLRVYKSIPHSLTFNHFVGEDIGIRKSISEVYVTFDQPYFTKSTVSFQTDLVPTSNSVNMWAYGYNYWNSSFPWALRVYTGQLLGRTLRTLVPTNSSKCSQMLVTLTHSRPWENFSVRGLKLRMTSGSTNIQRDNK